MLKERQRFIIDDPTSYRGVFFKYYVGMVVSTKWRFFGNDTEYDTAILTLNREIKTLEDIKHVRQNLLKSRQELRPQITNILILGIYRLED